MREPAEGLAAGLRTGFHPWSNPLTSGATRTHGTWFPLFSRDLDALPGGAPEVAVPSLDGASGVGTSGSTTTATGAGSDQSSTISTVGVGVAILLGGAAWWMVRREDEDEAPHPPRPSSSSDLI